jgi:hypothetical protein
MAITNAGRDFVAAQVSGTSVSTPAVYLALSASAVGAATATTLSGEITTASGGLVRALSTYTHNAGAATYTLSKTFTTTGSDALPVTIAKCGVFTASTGGTLVFETALSPTATLSASGDQLTLTETITISSV